MPQVYALFTNRQLFTLRLLQRARNAQFKHPCTNSNIRTSRCSTVSAHQQSLFEFGCMHNPTRASNTSNMHVHAHARATMQHVCLRYTHIRTHVHAPPPHTHTPYIYTHSTHVHTRTHITYYTTPCVLCKGNARTLALSLSHTLVLAHTHITPHICKNTQCTTHVRAHSLSPLLMLCLRQPIPLSRSRSLMYIHQNIRSHFCILSLSHNHTHTHTHVHVICCGYVGYVCISARLLFPCTYE